MKDIDYPAGHSMDSQWFAVDKDGNVGFFETGSEATMPVQFKRQWSWIDFIEEYTDKISNNLHKLILSEQRVSEIIGYCKQENVTELIKEAQNEQYLFFEGFLLLNDGYTWEDLNFEEALEKCEYDFALLVSENRQLYYISDVYDIYDVFLDALQENKIVACVKADLGSTSEDDESDINISILDGFEYVSQEFYAKPYERFSNPTEPLNIKQFSNEAKDKVMRFENLSFHEMLYLQPIEFTPCNSYGFDRYDVENGYAEVVLSDNETDAFAALSLEEWLKENYSRCRFCNGGDYQYSYDYYCGMSAGQEPKIIFVQYHTNNKSEENIIPQIKNILEISDEDWYLTNCIKCQKSGHNPTEEELDLRFTNCHRNLEKEIQIIHPLLIVAIGSNAYQLISSRFKIETHDDESINYITINNQEIAFVNIESKNKNIKEELLKIENIKTSLNLILAKERNLIYRPRIKPINRRF